MNYNQSTIGNGVPMPLMMGCTQPTQIQKANNLEPAIYDPISQVVSYNMREVGTKCLQQTMTDKKPGVSTPDQKNAIDDIKSV